MPEPDFIARVSYNVKYMPLFLKMTTLSMIGVVTGWAVGVTTCEFELVGLWTSCKQLTLSLQAHGFNP